MTAFSSPEKTGITLALKHLQALADAMGKASATARDLGPDRGAPSPPDDFSDMKIAGCG